MGVSGDWSRVRFPLVALFLYLFKRLKSLENKGKGEFWVVSLFSEKIKRYDERYDFRFVKYF